VSAAGWNPSPERQRAMIAAHTERMAKMHTYGFNEATRRLEVYKPANEGGAIVCSFDASADHYERAIENASAMCDELNGRAAPKPRQLALI
jgi:hypothetical protein